MRTAKFVLFAAIAGFMLIATAPAAQAQVGVNIGVAPDCLMVITMWRLMPALRRVITARNGLMEALS